MAADGVGGAVGFPAVAQPEAARSGEAGQAVEGTFLEIAQPEAARSRVAERTAEALGLHVEEAGLEDGTTNAARCAGMSAQNAVNFAAMSGAKSANLTNGTKIAGGSESA